MGVFGLLTFARNQPDICSDENIIQAKTASKRSNYLIVDLKNCQYALSIEKQRLNRVSGGQYLRQLHGLRNLVQKFEENDIRCLFVVDGSSCPPDKRSTKLKRRQERIQGNMKIFDALDSGEIDRTIKETGTNSTVMFSSALLR